MMPFSPKYKNKKPSFDALTYVKPSCRNVHQRPWQTDTWEAPERQWFDEGPAWVPEGQPSFVNARPTVTQQVLFGARPEAMQAAQWPGYHQTAADADALTRPISPLRRPRQRLESSSEDFYDTTESSSSYWDSRFSSESATVIRKTGQQSFDRDDSSSVGTAHATWTASMSSTLEEPSSARNEACSGGEYSGSSSSQEGRARPRFAGQVCLPIVGLAVLTSLLLLSAVTTVLRMSGAAGPVAAASQPLQPTSRDLAIHEIVAMMTPRRLLPQPTAAAVLPKSPRPLHHRGEATSRSAGKTASSTANEDEGATTDFFAGAPVALVGNLKHGAHRAHTRMPESFEASSPSVPATVIPACEEPSYTYCSESSPEYVYSRSRDACLLASNDTVELCSRGRNRFTSMHRCEMRCVNGERPSPRCLERSLFVPCGRDDVKSDLWFFDGELCAPWNFPSGHCPSNGSDVFSTASECTTRCTSPQSAPCATPQPAPCRRGQLRFPFFAHYSSQDGRVLCLKASAAVLRRRRCPTGGNRFNSTQACQHVCRKPKA